MLFSSQICHLPVLLLVEFNIYKVHIRVCSYYPVRKKKYLAPPSLISSILNETIIEISPAILQIET